MKSKEYRITPTMAAEYKLLPFLMHIFAISIKSLKNIFTFDPKFHLLLNYSKEKNLNRDVH